MAQQRILWVKVGGLWPTNVGGRQRSYQILSRLSERHRITVLTTHPDGEDGDDLALHLPNCERIVSFPYTAPKAAATLSFAGSLVRSWLSPFPVDLLKWRVPALQAEVERIMSSGGVDFCVADFLHAAANIPFDTAVPVILFSHNVEYMIWNRLATTDKQPLRRALFEIEWRKFRRYERIACARSHLVITVSPADRQCISENIPGARTRSISTGVDTSYFTANGTAEAPAGLVFVGAMDWFPNEDAMLFFFDEILPLIRSQVPEIEVTIVGRNPWPRLCTAAARAGVRVTGTVDDVRPFIDEATVYVVPLRVGGGTRLKIFEALSMGKAVVSTSIGAEGLPLIDGEHFVRADTPIQFCKAVVSLLRDRQWRKSLGDAGRNLVRAHYGWSAVTREFEAHCQEALLNQ